MATQSPISFLEGAFEHLASRITPPAWMVQETQQRLVLLLNHVIQQEPQAQARLKRQSGRVATLQWRAFSLRLAATPAGLLELDTGDKPADLALTVTQFSPFDVMQKLAKGEKPDVRIEGDVQLAAEVNWLVDHVRWDIEEDLSKVFGDVAAHRMGQIGRAIATAMRGFVASQPFSTLMAGAAGKPNR